MTAEPDPLIHPISRLLSKQSRVLEDARYVEVRKGAVGRRPRTWFRLTAEGRRAVEGHLAWLAQLKETVCARARDALQAGPLPGDRKRCCGFAP